jgi:hypothetical protein
MTILQQTIDKGRRFRQVSHRVQAHWTAFAYLADEIRQAARKRLSAETRPRKVCAGRPGAACVLYLIRNSDRGVHPALLAQMTGYDKRKLDRILHKLFKHGEIMIEAGGVYAPTRGDLFHTRRVH